MGKITISLAIDQEDFRRSLAEMFKHYADIKLVGQSGDNEEIVKLTGNLKPDIIIIDTVQHGLKGIEATTRIKASSPDTAIIILSDPNYQTHILSYLRAGAASYFFKDTNFKDLVTTIRQVRHEKALPGNNAQKNIHQLKDIKGKNIENLKLHPREIQILKLTAKGLRNKEIAKELNLSERTIQTHLSNIYSKLDVSSRTEAVLLGLKEGMLKKCDLK